MGPGYEAREGGTAVEIGTVQLEKLMARTGLSREEAAALLAKCGGSVLDAVLELERQGRIPPVRGGSYSTRFGAYSGGESAVPPPPEAASRRPFRWKEVGRVLKNLARHCTTISLEVWRKGEVMVAIPLVILVLLFLVAPYVMFPLTIVGLVLRCRYRLSGAEVENTPVNDTLKRASDVVGEWVEQVRREMDRDRKKK